MKLQQKIVEENLNQSPHITYQHNNGSLYQGDSIAWLKTLKSESVDLIFAVPPFILSYAWKFLE